MLLLKPGGISDDREPDEDPVLHGAQLHTQSSINSAEDHAVSLLIGCPAIKASCWTDEHQPAQPTEQGSSPSCATPIAIPAEVPGQGEALSSDVGHAAAGSPVAPRFHMEFGPHRVLLALGTAPWDTQLVRVGNTQLVRVDNIAEPRAGFSPLGALPDAAAWLTHRHVGLCSLPIACPGRSILFIWSAGLSSPCTAESPAASEHGWVALPAPRPPALPGLCGDIHSSARSNCGDKAALLGVPAEGFFP